MSDAAAGPLLAPSRTAEQHVLRSTDDSSARYDEPIAISNSR
jgi:hypothetical protein